MNKSFYHLTLVILLVWPGKQVFSVEPVKQTYLIGIQEFAYFPHYASVDNDFIGYSRDLLDAFAASQSYTFIYKSMPYRRLLDQFLNDKVDLQYPDNSYWQSGLKKNKQIYYSDAAVQYIDGMHVLPENLGKGLASLKHIGTLIGFSPLQYFPLEKEGRLTISFDASVVGLIKQVHSKRLDGVYLNVDVVRHLEKGHKSALVFDESLPFIKSGYSLSSIQYKNVIDDFNRFLITHKTVVDQIKAKYHLEE